MENGSLKELAVDTGPECNFIFIFSEVDLWKHVENKGFINGEMVGSLAGTVEQCKEKCENMDKCDGFDFQVFQNYCYLWDIYGGLDLHDWNLHDVYYLDDGTNRLLS